MDEETIKKYFIEEVKTIQEIIKRMASNSFMLKGWAVTLVTATLLLKVATDNKFAIIIGFIPLFSFWMLDSFYLRQEKLYRKLYEWTIHNRLSDKENTRKCFDMSTSQFCDEIPSTYKVMFSPTLRVFYIPTALLLLIYFLVVQFLTCKIPPQ
jgi:hypothetical protein